MIKKRWHVLEGLVKKHGWRDGVELGVFRGETFCHLIQTCPNLSLTGVDRFSTEFYQSTRVGRPPKSFDLEAEYWRLYDWCINRSGGRGRLLREDTTDAARFYGDGELDFVFVDADHRYDAVAADLDAWRPKVRADGWLLGHDWNLTEFPGVVRAVGERFGQRVQLFDDHVWGVPL